MEYLGRKQNHKLIIVFDKSRIYIITSNVITKTRFWRYTAFKMLEKWKWNKKYSIQTKVKRREKDREETNTYWMVYLISNKSVIFLHINQLNPVKRKKGKIRLKRYMQFEIDSSKTRKF